MKLRIIVTGLIAQHPRLGGVAWDYVQYATGLRRLGHDVYYFEDTGEWPYNVDGGPSGTDWIAKDPLPNVEHLGRVMSRFGLGDRWAYRYPVRPRWYGMSHSRRRDVMRTADLLINVSGTLERPARYRSIPRLAYIDSDPVFTQVKLNLPRGHKKFARRVNLHDAFFSFGEVPSDKVPPTGHRWIPTRQPIVLSEWRGKKVSRPAFSTVMSWTSYRPLVFQGKRFGQKDVEFMRFVDLPSRVTPAVLEVALGPTRHAKWESLTCGVPERARNYLDNNPDDTTEDLLRHMGWRVSDAGVMAADMDSYRGYIRNSFAEWSIAKNGYVAGQSGWFSCRSACYLASGKPVVVQDTGFGSVLPVGKGILHFTSPQQAAHAIGEVIANYRHHSTCAREIAEEYFDSDKVLGRLIDDAMSSSLPKKQPGVVQ